VDEVKLMLIAEQFNDLEKVIMQYQDHALRVNEAKNNGVKDIPIESYLKVLDLSINLLSSINDEVCKMELKLNDQNDKIDNLLDLLNLKR
jgi:hypothetical protein